MSGTDQGGQASGSARDVERLARRPVAPYMAVGLSTIVYGVAERKHIKVNLDIIEDNIHAAMSMVNINMPVKLIALAEGALTGFTDEAFDLPHTLAARELFIDIPGPETERLAGLAKMYGTYIIVQCKARWPEVMANRFFNTLFIISPAGEIVHRAAKNHIWCRERSCVPHDVYDRWVELFGDGIEAFYPVLRTDDIGNVGTICCSDGEYPEAVRALAFNGAEVVYRPSEAMPMTGNSYPGGGGWMIQNRGHAQFNSLYMICPNVGPVYLHPKMRHPVDIAGGNSHIVDYYGNIMSYSASGANTMVAAVLDIEALRQFRAMNLNSQLDEGPPDRSIPAHVRAADPSEEPLDGTGPALTRAGGRDLSRQHSPPCQSRRVHTSGDRLPRRRLSGRSHELKRPGRRSSTSGTAGARKRKGARAGRPRR